MKDAEAVAPVADVDQLVKVYIKIRDARDEVTRKAKEQEVQASRF